HRVEEEAFHQVAPPLVLVHLLHHGLDLPHHVLEGDLQRALEGDLAVEGLEQAEHVAVERELEAGGKAHSTHRPFPPGPGRSACALPSWRSWSPPAAARPRA